MTIDLEDTIYNSYFDGYDKRVIYGLLQQLVQYNYTKQREWQTQLYSLSKGKKKVPGKSILTTCYQELKNKV